MHKIVFILSFLTITSGLKSQNIQLSNLWLSYAYSSKGVASFNAMNDGEHFTRLEKEGLRTCIVKYSFASSKAVDTLFNSQIANLKGVEDYQFSKDEKKIILKHNITPIYRHSSTYTVSIYTIETKKVQAVSNGNAVSLARFNYKSDKVAYVKNNNLYYTDLKADQEFSITKDGEKNTIINGMPDWVYEEEFSFHQGYHWSSVEDKIVYYKFDESAVRTFSMNYYTSEVYPEDYSFKYPKVGEDNSKVTLHCYDLTHKTDDQLSIQEPYEYIPRIQFTPDGQLSVQTLNRHQNKLHFYLLNLQSKKAKKVFTEESDTYIDVHDNLVFFKDKPQFVWTSETTGYNHIYLYDFQGKLIRPLSDGKYDVDQMLGIDQDKGYVYYTSSEVSPLERHLYAQEIEGKEKIRLTHKKGTHTISFAKGHNYYIDNYSASGKPSVITLKKTFEKQGEVLEDNSALSQKLDALNLGEHQFFDFKTPEGITLNGYMILPPNFDKSKQYPLLLYVYGGPGSQTVTDSWGGSGYLWAQHLAQQGYIVASVDNRGTGARGAEFKKCTYLNLGKIESQDQISAAKYLGGLSYIDKDRIGIWGWSYGGYMSSLCLFTASDIFKMGISVAPVTHWKFYDSIYTERYMRTQKENKEGYDAFAPLIHAGKLKGKFMLVHGVADDNVHFQNAVELVNQLNQEEKEYRFYMYPNKNHGIYGGNTRYDLYKKMTAFVLKNL